MCHTSVRFHVIILITQMFTDTRRPFSKENKMVENFEFSIGQIHKILRERNVY